MIRRPQGEDDRLRWAALISGTTGGLACGQLGAMWLRDALRMREGSAVAIAVGVDPTMLLIVAVALLMAMVAGIAGSVLVHHRRVASGTIALFVAGVIPGVLDPRAFVVTWALCLAGIVALGIPPASASRTRRGRDVPWLARQSHVSTG